MRFAGLQQGQFLALGLILPFGLLLTFSSGCSKPKLQDDWYGCSTAEGLGCPAGMRCMPVPGGGGLERCYTVDPTNDAAPPDAATEDGGPPDAATDGALPDAALIDASPPDAAPRDAAAEDGGPPDAAPPDGAPPDAAQPDASLPDAASPDAAQLDASLPDAAPPDAAQLDAALPDSGTPCVDSDGDGYGEGCVPGPDCDDAAPGITGACQANGCPQGWAYIPAGSFEMGCNTGELDGTCQASEQPRHTVTMTAYCMEVTEVSVGAYRACKNAGQCTGTPVDSGGAYNWTATPIDREAHPINGINWAESREYCQVWVGGDLPTEAQWEKAARGGPGDLRKYTWGSSPEPDCTRANGWYGSYCNAARTWPVGYLTSTAGDSPYGLKDMAGNVWEWVLDYYSDTFYQQCSSGCTDPANTAVASYRVIRGGCYNDATLNLRAVARLVMNPADRVNNYGFRCRRTPACVDNDGDGYGDGCALGPDCDDNAPGITGACQANGCPQGWAYIPAGDFEMGCNPGELNGTCLADEQPRHTVTLGAYCMELTEVSVGAYRACKEASVCTGTPNATGGWYNWTESPGAREAHPINGIFWAESQQYCQAWMGGDLPTEAEWEKGARGGPGDTRKYPWGATPEPDCTRANFDVNGPASGFGCGQVAVGPGTWPVGYLTTTFGDSPYGLKDMAGNAWEWVQDYYSATFYSNCTGGCSDPLNSTWATQRVYRAGGFDGAATYLRVVWRGAGDPTYRGNFITFRCRRTP